MGTNGRSAAWIEPVTLEGVGLAYHERRREKVAGGAGLQSPPPLSFRTPRRLASVCLRVHATRGARRSAPPRRRCSRRAPKRERVRAVAAGAHRTAGQVQDERVHRKVGQRVVSDRVRVVDEHVRRRGAGRLVRLGRVEQHVHGQIGARQVGCQYHGA
jgi:hypothetical protein